MGAAVGIDLGTTNSVVATRNAFGRPEVIQDPQGSHLTPSVIYFGVDPPAVGHEAKEYAKLGDEQIASFFKPQMGNPEFRLEFGGRAYDATALSTLVLRRLKALAEERLGAPVDRAVITVPAYFADPQRKATITAGEAAGLEILRIMNEPTAAALAYGLQSSDSDEHVLIYDLGGGTFDVTVAHIDPRTIEVLATTGDHDLGGKNWDDRIATFLAERFAERAGYDPLDDPPALNEVLVRSEMAKHQLSDRSATRVTLQLGTDRVTVELTRDQFESMTSPLMDRTRSLTEEALGAAGLDWSRLSGVLLVGGSTRMPMVRRYVKTMSGRAPQGGVNVDEVVALGAAIQAAVDVGESAETARPQFTIGGSTAPAWTLPGSKRIQDVMSHSLGTVAVNEEKSAYINDIIIPKNRPIPQSETKRYRHTTHGGANDRMEVYVTQGESRAPLDCSILGKYVFTEIESTAEEVEIDVALSYDQNGVVQVVGVQRGTGRTLPMHVEPVPDDLSWLGRPPQETQLDQPGGPIVVYLLLDASSSMAGEPLKEAQEAARGFLDQFDFRHSRVGLIAFSSQAALLAEATDNPRRLLAAIGRIDADGSTNLTEALGIARRELEQAEGTRYVVLLTDGYPDSPGSAFHEADQAKSAGTEIVAIGIGEADIDYLRKLSSTEAGSIFAQRGQLVSTFGHIGQVIAEGGRSLRVTT